KRETSAKQAPAIEHSRARVWPHARQSSLPRFHRDKICERSRWLDAARGTRQARADFAAGECLRRRRAGMPRGVRRVEEAEPESGRRVHQREGRLLARVLSGDGAESRRGNCEPRLNLPIAETRPSIFGPPQLPPCEVER